MVARDEHPIFVTERLEVFLRSAAELDPKGAEMLYSLIAHWRLRERRQVLNPPIDLLNFLVNTHQRPTGLMANYARAIGPLTAH